MGIKSFLRYRGKSQSRSRLESSPPSPTTGDAATNAATTEPVSAADELERVFRKFDSNGDGQISSAELGEILRSLGYGATAEELAKMMQEADVDGDGFISLQEFVDLNTRHAGDPDAVEEDLRHAFSVFDLDRNGSISADELARVLRGLGETTTVAQCRRMIDGVDQDGDGQISFEEFKVMMAGRGATTAGLPKI